MICSKCGIPPATTNTRYCIHCGQKLSSPAPAIVHNGAVSRESTSGHSVGFINTMRIIAAACMFSGMYAALTYETTTQPGRLLVMSSVGVAMVGMMFVFQVSRTSPPAWANALLPAFWIGILALIALWAVCGFG